MRARLVASGVGLVGMAGGYALGQPAISDVGAHLHHLTASGALAVPTRASLLGVTLDHDQRALAALWATLRGDTTVTGPRPLAGGVAALAGALTFVGAVGGGIARAYDPVLQKEREKAAQKAKDEAPITATKRDLRRDKWLSPRGLAHGRVGWPLGRDVATGRPVIYPRAEQATHTFVVGASGSGKSSALLVPWILSEADLPERRRASLIVLDPKAGGELAGITLGYMVARGYRAWVYNPLADGTLRFNVLSLAPTVAQVRLLMGQWVSCTMAPGSPEQSFWRDMKIALLAGAVVVLRAEARRAGRAWQAVSMADVADLYHEAPIEDVIARIAALGEAPDADRETKAVAAAMATLAGGRYTRDAMAGVEQALACLSDDRVAASMRGAQGGDMDAAFWRNVVERPTVLYVPVDMDEAGSVRPVVVTFLVAAMLTLKRQAPGNGRPLPRPIRVIADEVANFGVIRGLGQIASTVRYANIGLVLATQTPGDLARVYGKEAEAIEGNLSTHIVLAKSVPAALKRYAVSDLNLGLVRLMERNTALVQRAGDLPIRVVTRGWYRSRRLRRAITHAQKHYDLAACLRWQAALQAEHDAAGAASGESAHTAHADRVDGILEITGLHDESGVDDRAAGGGHDEGEGRGDVDGVGAVTDEELAWALSV